MYLLIYFKIIIITGDSEPELCDFIEDSYHHGDQTTENPVDKAEHLTSVAIREHYKDSKFTTHTFRPMCTIFSYTFLNVGTCKIGGVYLDGCHLFGTLFCNPSMYPAFCSRICLPNGFAHEHGTYLNMKSTVIAYFNFVSKFVFVLISLHQFTNIEF